MAKFILTKTFHMGVQTKTNTQMLTAALFIIAPKWKQPKCHLADKGISKLVYPYNGLLFSHREEWSANTCSNLDEIWKHHTKWSKPDTKGHISYGSMYMKYPEQAHLERQKQIGGWEGTGSDCLMGTEFPLGVMRKFW